MKKHSILYVRRFKFAREQFIESFADSPLFEVMNVAENIEQALILTKTQKPSLIVTGAIFEDGTVKDLVRGVESILNFRPHIVLVTALSPNNANRYSYGITNHAFYNAICVEDLKAYFENLFMPKEVVNENN